MVSWKCSEFIHGMTNSQSRPLEEHRDVDLRTDFVMYAEGKNAHIIKIMPNLFETQKQP